LPRRFLQRNERAHKRNKDRRADLESEFLGDNQMARFMDEQKQDKTQRELPSPQLHVNPDHQQHGAAGLQQNGQDEFELRKKFCDHDTHDRDRAQRLFYPAPGSLFSWRLVLLGLSV
jgi:hypothetical protein